MKEKFKVLKLLFIINDIFLLPGVLCWIVFLLSRFELFYDFCNEAILLLYFFIQYFMFNYIASTVITIVYVIALIKYKFPKKETVAFIILLIICILEILSTELFIWL